METFITLTLKVAIYCTRGDLKEVIYRLGKPQGYYIPQGQYKRQGKYISQGQYILEGKYQPQG